jgi:membrane complex biogenesis BtpA family protein
MAWNVKGTYFETCSCDLFCPCNISMAHGATYDYCRVTLVFNITEGEVEGTDVGGLAVAAVVGARFIRVNVHAGAVVADQGIVETDAYHTLRDRRLLSVEVRIFADVGGKHAVPLVPVELEQTARDLAHRGLADALVVSGPATGQATPLTDVKRVRSAVPDVPILVGSGVTAETVAELLSVADGAIVGTAVKHGGDVRNPVDRGRVERLVAAARRR